MALPATESFTGGAGALAGSWTQQRTTPTVRKDGAGAGIGSTAGNYHSAFWNADVFSDDQYSQLTILAGIAAGEVAMPRVRAAQTGDAAYDNYGLYADSTDCDIVKVVDGGTTVLSAPLTTFANGDVIRLEVEGTTLTAYKNGGSVGSVVDSALSSGSAGCGMRGNVVTIDNWEGGNIIPPSAALTGTATASITETDIVAGGKTVIVTLTGATWVPA